MIDNSKYKQNHNKIIEYVKEMTGINLNMYRDGDGTSPYMTTYWDINGPKLCVNWCGSVGGMDKITQVNLLQFSAHSSGKLVIEDAGAWIKYIYLKEG